jgi:hypothetical protein
MDGGSPAPEDPQTVLGKVGKEGDTRQKVVGSSRPDGRFVHGSPFVAGI